MEFKPRCLKCRRPQAVCWCDAVVEVPSQTQVVFLQHPREAKVAVSTCRMAHLSLPGSKLHVGLDVDAQPALVAQLSQPGTYVLFPSPDATDVAALDRPPRTLVVVDGTWSNARKVVERSPLLKALPRLAFNPGFESNYRIRKEPAKHCLSTIEATAHVLEHLERAPGRYTPMLRAFERMVELQLGFIARGEGKSRYSRHKGKRERPRLDPLAPLREVGAALVLLYAEANAWPAQTDDPPAPEVVQLVALKPATGERFAMLVAPRQALSPRVAFHLDLPEEELFAGLGLAAAQARWREFLGEGAVLGVWGHSALTLLRSEPGWHLPPFLDLRALRTAVTRRRPGPLEALALAQGVALPEGQGRAARRLVSLAAIMRELQLAGAHATSLHV